MSLIRLLAAFLPAALAAAAAAQLPLPELKVEATDGGSAIHIRNVAPQPLTAYFIELVGYPGSSFAMYQECLGRRTVAPGAGAIIPITNMTVGAAPEYVKMQAALYADGSSAGSPEKIAQIIGLRRTTLETTRELIARIAAGKDGDRSALVDSLRQWAGSIPEPTKRERGTPAAITRSTQRDLIHSTATRMEVGAPADILAALAESERALASSKPALFP